MERHDSCWRNLIIFIYTLVKEKIKKKNTFNNILNFFNYEKYFGKA